MVDSSTKISKRLRLIFEPMPGTDVNHDEMFKHYVMNYLSGFDVMWGGMIAFDWNKRKSATAKSEPLYQVLINEHTYATKMYLLEYIRRNPLVGYYTHVYEKNREVNEVEVT